MIVASDLNGTLTTGAPILAVANWAGLNQPGLGPKLYKYWLLLSYLSVRLGIIETHIWADKFLRDVLGLSILEISNVLSLSQKGCKARLGRARLMIRRSLIRDRGNIEATHTSNTHEHTSTHPDLLV